MQTTLRQVRLADNRKLSQESVADSLGMEQSYYSKIEGGKQNASAELAVKIAAFFNLPVEAVFTPSRYAAELATVEA